MRLEVFRRINQGGTPLSGQDIRLAYYGEQSPSLGFIRLAGIHDPQRQSSQRFIGTAKTLYGQDYPWIEPNALRTWHDLWDGKDLTRGQTASEMFLWSLVAAQFSQLDDILQHESALSALGVRFNRSIDEALDVYCAQTHYQDKNRDQPKALMDLKEMRESFFPFFSAAVHKIGSMGPSLDVRKHRTVASVIGGAYRAKIPLENWTTNHWGQMVEFIRRPTERSAALGIDWPQSKGRWDGIRGNRAQLEAASKVVTAISR